MHLVEVAAELLAQGKTLFDRLDDLAVRHGVSAGDQWSVVLPGSEGQRMIATAMEALRASGPSTLGGSPVTHATDLLAGTTIADGVTTDATMPKSNVLVFTSKDGTRLTVRPSGTEPKIKMYLEATDRVASKEELPACREKLRTRLQTVRDEVDSLLGLAPA